MGTHINFNNIGGGGGGEGSNQMKPTDNAYPLARQSSLYSLTFDELQSTLLGGPGKDFGSMNMDELLKSIWTAEEAQAMTMTSSAAAATAVAQPGGGIPLQRQGSLTLPRTISQKTVDEVWKCLFTKDGNMVGSSGGGSESNAPQRQQTLGEITLEEFLLRAGVVREDNNNNNGFYSNNGAPGGQQLNQPPHPPPHQRMPQTIFPKQANVAFAGAGNNAGNNNNNGLGSFGGGGVTVAATSPGTSSAENNSLSPVPYVLNRGRRSNTGLEKVIERRQRRMIKNRESAARSRARKQAYTLELEAEIEKLKKVNQELQKKQAEMMEMQKNELKESSKQPWGSKRQCLRRTLTGPW
ncbi:BnaA01g26200D [Brassica napus]|uniref:BnaA01g26200D protein n=1 Tax=Brassica napus TaxID=3708 RepID=A0A078FVZ7_BRANA|nr:BnaA01g26200D [Brassica napus]